METGDWLGLTITGTLAGCCELSQGASIFAAAILMAKATL
jgi:hypothetical protein